MMKPIFTYICMLGILVAGIFGCDNNESALVTKVGKVEKLYTPEDNYSVTLQPNGSETFEWAPAKAEDGGYVSYEVAFDSVGGDFSNPIYRAASDNQGVSTTATISDKKLNQAAALAGLESEETGKLDWAVISSRGVNEKVSSETRTIQITRLAGIANPPSNLYITGAGTEAGANLEDAMALKSTGDGQFEIYTKLTTDGSYKFVSSNSGDPRNFTISGGSIKQNGDGSTVDHDGVYRIKLDFTTGSATIKEVTDLQLYLSDTDSYLFSLEYQGDGTFLADNVESFFYQASYGLDSRYKFRMTLQSDGQTTYEWFANNTQSGVQNPTSSTPDAYFDLYPFEYGSINQYDHCFKLNKDLQNSIIDVYAYFQAGGHYTHEITKVKDQ